MDDRDLRESHNLTDGHRRRSGLLPDIGENDLYDGDHEPDIDERYARGDTLEASPESRSDDGVRERNLFRMLSAEMNSDHYRIRTPKQQSDWSKKKTQNVRQMAKYMLRLKSVVLELIDICRGRQVEKLLGQMVTGDDGQVRLNYDLSLCDEVAGLLSAHLEGTCHLGIEELSELIAVQYNLSYAQFVRDRAHRLMKEFDEAKAEYEKFLAGQPEGKTMSLLALSEDISVSKVKAMEDETGLDWPLICTVVRNIRLLHLSSEQLKERLVCTNLRGCLGAAMNHYHQVGGARNVNFDEKDLISEAAMGLMHAADMYVHGTSARFTTYAEYWVRLKVTRYTKDNNSVRVPVHVSDMANVIVRVFRDHENKQRMSGATQTPLSCADVEKLIGKKIGASVWEHACNRYRGAALAVSCTTTSDSDEGDIDFDAVMEPHEGEEETSTVSDAHSILETAQSMIGTGDKNALTQQQYDIMYMSYMLDMKNGEIAEELSKRGTAVEPKIVRAELNTALTKIRGFLKLGKLDHE